MLPHNPDGLYPSILVHRSHRGLLVIGGAMFNYLEQNEELARMRQAAMFSGGWHTRFDGGAAQANDLPCSVVAMYVNGLYHTTGVEGAYDTEFEAWPTCYARVTFRWTSLKADGAKTTILSDERSVYLQSQFSFLDVVRHDGIYDLQDAFDVALRKGRYEQKLARRATRDWHLVAKTRVPGQARQMLHKTIKSVDTVISNNFGQGKKFFDLPKPRRHTR